MNGRILALALIAGTLSSCASARIRGNLQGGAENWAVYKVEATNDYLVIAKDRKDLDEALTKMGCRSEACSVGHVGDLYAVKPLAKAEPKE